MIQNPITTAAEAKAFIQHLFATGKFFHPEDKAEDITDQYGRRIFSACDADHLNDRMDEIRNIDDDDGSLMEYMADEMNRIYVQPYIATRIHPDSTDKLTAFRHQAAFRMLVTLVNLHDGIPHGGNGITETDWQNARNLIASLRS